MKSACEQLDQCVCLREVDEAQVLLLGSLDAEIRRDSQIGGSQIRYVTRHGIVPPWLSDLGIQELEVQFSLASKAH